MINLRVTLSRFLPCCQKGFFTFKPILIFPYESFYVLDTCKNFEPISSSRFFSCELKRRKWMRWKSMSSNCQENKILARTYTHNRTEYLIATPIKHDIVKNESCRKISPSPLTPPLLRLLLRKIFSLFVNLAISNKKLF